MIVQNKKVEDEIQKIRTQISEVNLTELTNRLNTITSDKNELIQGYKEKIKKLISKEEKTVKFIKSKNI